MVKLKKALKKLTQIGSGKPASRAAKKEVPVKKKSAPMPSAAMKKKAAAKPAGKRDAEVADAKKKAAAASKKGPAKKPDASKAPLRKPAPAKAVVVAKKATDKSAEKVSEKTSERAAVSTLERREAAPIAAEPAKLKKAPVPEALTAKVKDEKAQKAEKPVMAERTRKAKEAGAVSPASAEVETAGEDYDEEAEVILTDAEGRRYCRVKECDQIAAVDGYCRYHYLLFWKKIQVRKKILSEGKLERYIEELTARYPDKYLEMLRKDLRSEKDFTAAITELEIDDSGVDTEFEDEAQSYLDEVRGMGGESTGREEEEY